MSEKKAANLTCQVTGSRPRPVITWLKDDTVISGAVTHHRADNVTSSTLALLPSADDSGHVIRCRAYSPTAPQTALEDFVTLRVNHRPRLRITVGRTLQLSDIEEGDDVYFECHVDAQPPIYGIEWRINGRPVDLSQSSGVIIINQTLVLQAVARESGGVYTCSAANVEGQGDSDGLLLRVQYAPRCRAHQKAVFGAALMEHVHVPCHVEALPGPLTFRWAFNNTGEISYLPTHQFAVNGSWSTADYVPRSELDYGTVLCWAQNRVGLQRQPCVFHIVPANVPEPPSSCTSHNSSGGSLTVQCRSPDVPEPPSSCTSHSSSSGSLTRFVLELRGAAGRVHYNVTAASPRFIVHRPPGDALYQIMIYAVNAKGRSKPMLMEPQPPRDAAERRTERVIDGSLKEQELPVLELVPPGTCHTIQHNARDPLNTSDCCELSAVRTSATESTGVRTCRPVATSDRESTGVRTCRPVTTSDRESTGVRTCRPVVTSDRDGSSVGVRIDLTVLSS
ncbi:kin of IRRE-like protein 1 [Pollicipes pollicipes]|uniref:kin of IRRE-like protein 1 n=1 Tax=Pollicipes pollicipes TaxID=41117 RepID=UPI001884AA99|nr:kin of IRRE-like protein 1 [Pollicipes pollicipes]